MHACALELAILRELDSKWLTDWLMQYARVSHDFPTESEVEAGLSILHARLAAVMGGTGGMGWDGGVRRNIILGTIIEEWGESFAGACLRHLDAFMNCSARYAAIANQAIEDGLVEYERPTVNDFLPLFTFGRDHAYSPYMPATTFSQPPAPKYDCQVVLSTSDVPRRSAFEEEPRLQQCSPSYSQNTEKAYRSALRQFESWGGFLPCCEEEIIRYLEARFHSMKASSLALHMAALSSWHKRQGFANPEPPRESWRLVGLS